MKSTKHTSFIPMTPDARPNQRLNVVRCVADKPNDLDVLIQWKNPIPYRYYPKGTPRKLIFVLIFQINYNSTSDTEQDQKQYTHR